MNCILTQCVIGIPMHYHYVLGMVVSRYTVLRTGGVTIYYYTHMHLLPMMFHMANTVLYIVKV